MTEDEMVGWHHRLNGSPSYEATPPTPHPHPLPETPLPPATPTYHLPGCSGKRRSAHPQGPGWDGTGLHAGKAETHREIRQSDSGDLGKQKGMDQLPVGNTGRIPGQPPLPMLTCEARVTQAAEAPTWVLQAVPGMCRVAGTWATLIDVPLTLSSCSGGSQAPRRAVCGKRGSLRTMHGGGSAPSPRTPLSSRVATRVSRSPLSGLKGVQPPLPFGERTRGKESDTTEQLN